MADQLLIEGLRLETCIGVHSWERTIRQTVVLDLTLWPAGVATGDRLASTVDYQAVSERLAAFVGNSDFELIETLAEAVAGLLLGEFAITALRLKLSKPGAVPRAENVAVMIERPVGRFPVP